MYTKENFMEDFLNEREVEADFKRCNGCGGAMVFDIESGNLKCERCGNMMQVDDGGAVQRREMTAEIMKSHENWKDGAVSRCDGCGAKGVVERNSLSKHCAFCGSSRIVALEELAGIKPDSVIPFQVTKETARQKFTKWLKSKIFAPAAIKRLRTDEQFNAVYSSSWSFSANTQSRYAGTLGRRVTRRTSRGTTTTIRYFRVQGDIAQNYRDFFVQSGDRIASAAFNKLQPFNLQLVKAYRQEFLAGIVAEHYSRTIDICFNDFANFVQRDLRRRIMQNHHAHVVQSLNIQTNYSNKAFNYVLLPIYIANYTWKGKLYNFYVNGASGNIVGKYPLSIFRVGLAVIGAIVALAVAGILIWQFG
jgi:ribosomal protein S27E